MCNYCYNVSYFTLPKFLRRLCNEILYSPSYCVDFFCFHFFFVQITTRNFMFTLKTRSYTILSLKTVLTTKFTLFYVCLVPIVIHLGKLISHSTNLFYVLPFILRLFVPKKIGFLWEVKHRYCDFLTKSDYQLFHTGLV